MDNWAAEKGQDAEQDIKRFLEAHYPWPVFANVYIPAGGHSTEVDILMVTSFGLCVIECKAYKGQIFGTDSDQMWTQFLDGQTFSFYNPVKQNAGHCDRLAEYLHIDRSAILSIICFSDTADITRAIVDTGDGDLCLCNFCELEDTLELLIDDHEDIFDEAAQAELIHQVEALSDSGQAAKEQHISRLKSNIHGLCPVCGRPFRGDCEIDDRLPYTLCPVCGKPLLQF